MPLLVILFAITSETDTCLYQVQAQTLLEHLHLFLTMKPQHLSSVASDTNRGFTAQIERCQQFLFKETEPP